MIEAIAFFLVEMILACVVIVLVNDGLGGD